MKKMNLSEIRTEITNAFTGAFESVRIPDDEYTDFSYPRFIKLMKFNTERYEIKGFGHFMTMHTKTRMGMELLTAAFTPGEGTNVPFLLTDMMTLGKKRTVFVEYYDCRSEKGREASMELLEKTAEKFSALPNYQEKDKWYVKERAPYSLIKCGTAADDGKLSDMVISSVSAYLNEAKAASQDSENIKGLLAFRERMVKEGNPSSSVLEKVFGKAGAENFFKKCVMRM